MPHLSPMNWLMALTMFWLVTLMISTKLWWSTFTSMPFKLSMKKSSKTTMNQWKW